MKTLAHKLLSCDIAVMPVVITRNEKGEKKIKIGRSWKEFQERMPKIEELSFTTNSSLAVICGKISGNLEAIDFDEKYRLGIFAEWKQIVPIHLINKLVITKTPTGGFHCLYRCEEIGGNQKLCRDAPTITSIETRGEGGFVFEPPSEGYEMIQGDLCAPPSISKEERSTLLSAAVSLSRFVEVSRTPTFTNLVGRPGDDFNLRGNLQPVLEKHGWALVGERGGVKYWRRPGKVFGISATENYDGRGLFHIFSSSTPFEVGSHSKFSVLATLEFQKKWADAAAFLRENGYGQEQLNGYNTIFPRSVSDEINYRRLSEVKAQAVEWLWEGKIPKRKITLIAGNPGKGKSQIALDCAARVSSGAPFPLSSEKRPPRSVIILSAEDDVADTIKPRVAAMEGVHERIYVIQGVRRKETDGSVCHEGFDITKDMDALSRMVEAVGDVGLVIIDPISAYMGKADSHKNSDVRALLLLLAVAAAERDFSVIAITHFNKSATKESIAKITGSLAFGAAPRAVFSTLDDEQEPGRRLFLPVKNNLAQDTKGLDYKIQEWGQIIDGVEIKTSRISWGNEIIMSADEGLSGEGEGGDKFMIAKEFLESELEMYPEGIALNELKSRARKERVSIGSLYRAARFVPHTISEAGKYNAKVWKLKQKELLKTEDF